MLYPRQQNSKIDKKWRETSNLAPLVPLVRPFQINYIPLKSFWPFLGLGLGTGSFVANFKRFSGSSGFLCLGHFCRPQDTRRLLRQNTQNRAMESEWHTLPVVESSIAVEDAVENRGLYRVFISHLF